MAEFTKGQWGVIISTFQHNPKEVITGVGIVTYRSGNYTEMICNSILPENDAEYIKQHDKIEADMRLISAAPNLLQALQELNRLYKDQVFNFGCDDEDIVWKAFKDAESAIQKALGEK